jgi:hypothetical protein
VVRRRGDGAETETLARAGSPAQDARMIPTGTALARPFRMNDRPLVPAPSLLSLESPAPAPLYEEQHRDDDGGEEIDKYDISTLACTD